MNTTDQRFMRRAAQLALNGRGFTHPNPMVGAVIVADGRIIGEGWHRRYGGPHAEVNAVAAVADRSLLHRSTIYVTLEPCSHYGKTPPCAKLLIDCGIPRIVVGSLDPFPEVSGRGIQMLRDAGREVVTGVLADVTDEINRPFMTAHRLKRPYVRLKWAQSADGFMAAFDADGQPRPAQLSGPLGTVLMHRERATADAIMVGTHTANIDNPRLTLRHWPGLQPKPVTFNTGNNLLSDRHIITADNSIILTEKQSLADTLASLYTDHGITDLMVEGGPTLLQSFIDAGLWDEARIETTPHILGHGLKAPAITGTETSPLPLRDSVIEVIIKH